MNTSLAIIDKLSMANGEFAGRAEGKRSGDHRMSFLDELNGAVQHHTEVDALKKKLFECVIISR